MTIEIEFSIFHWTYIQVHSWMNVPEILSSLGFVLTSGILRQLQRPPLRLEATEFLHIRLDISKQVVSELL